MATTICKRVVVTGDVQGVFFRDTCRQTAGLHGVNGWVHNLPDGSVEALFEGEPSAVDKMLEWAQDGPPAAFVDEVREFDEEPQGLSGFEVRTMPPKRGRRP